MNNDFAKLAAHETHVKILARYIQYRVPKATKEQIDDILDRCLKKKLTSAVALNELCDINARGSMVVARNPTISKEKSDHTYEENRVAARICDLEPFEQQLKDAKITSYLDIGCGNGTITAALGSHFGLKPDKIYGADIPNWAGHEHKQESAPGFTFKTIDIASDTYSIPMESGSCQLVSLLMVLHHVKDDILPLMFREVSRILAPGGLVLVREHDSPNEMVDSLINIEHGIFEVVLEELTDGESFGKNYYGKYRTKREWRSMFANFGFTHLATTKHSGATRGYYSLFKRSNSAIPPIDSKETPELIKDVQAIGASPAMIKAARNNEDLKKLIVGGRRELAKLEASGI
jgi:ubiquinone/menaquinone biosynthesis C-methylase UbiE